MKSEIPKTSTHPNTDIVNNLIMYIKNQKNKSEAQRDFYHLVRYHST